MSFFQPKQNRWLSIGLALMLFALVSFSMMPLISSFFLVSHRTNNSAPSSLSSKWEAEAMGYQTVLEREPENQNALRGLLDARLRQGNLPEAIAPLAKLALLNPERTDYSILLAQSQQQLQDYAGAEATYRSLLTAHPGDMPVLKSLVDLLSSQNRSDEAIALVETRIAKGNQDKEPQGNLTSLQLLLGEIYIDGEQWERAIAVYDRAIEENGQDFRPLLAKALVLQRQGEDAQAAPLFEKAVMLAPLQYKDELKVMAKEDQGNS